MSNYTFDSDSLKYLLDKLKELFSLKSEADLKVDKVDGKDLVTNDYTDEYAQLNNKIINDIAISDKTDTEITLTFSRKNGNSSSIKIPYDKYKKSALFVDAPEKFLCLANKENKINYRYISSLKDGNHNLVVEIVKSTGASTNYQESYTYDEIPDYYLYVPDEEDIALRMYFIDSENTMTGVACLEPEVAYLVAEYILNEINDNAYPDCNDGSFTNFATNDTQNDDNTFTRTVFAGKEGPTKIDFRNIVGLTKINKIGPSVTNMTNAFFGCSNLTGSPVCGDNVTDMAGAYQSCTNLTGSPVCGPKVTNMHQTYCDCNNLTGSPVCGNNVTNMSGTYHYCFNLTGSPVCGNSVTNMNSAYRYCQNLTGAPVCGNNVFDMANTYAKCHNLAGQPVCGDNVTNMSNTYIDCSNLTGNPACGNNVTNMSCTYTDCSNLTGNPVCGDKVIDMGGAYKYCYNITGSPVCGPKATTMTETYYECTNLTGNPVCGDNVIAMDWTYYNCYNLTGVPVCGYNVNSMFQTYYNCRNLSSNAYFYSNKITYAVECFGERNTDKRLNLYVPENSTTLTTCLCDSSSSSLTGTDITWTNDMSTNRCYYNTAQNIYIYPVANVEQTYKDNELLLAKSTMNSGTNVVPEVDSTTLITMEDTTNDDSTITRSVYLDESQKGKLLSSISFNGETGLLTVEKLKIDNISDASYMFNGCSNLTSVRAMDWDTSKITKADYMFAGCSKLTKESFTNFELPNVESASHIFDGCTNLF